MFVHAPHETVVAHTPLALPEGRYRVQVSLANERPSRTFLRAFARASLRVLAGGPILEIAEAGRIARATDRGRLVRER